MRRILCSIMSVLFFGTAFAQYAFVKQWDKRYGGIGHEWLYALCQTSDGEYILGGTSESPVGGDKTEDSRGWFDYWVVKIDSLGNKEWDKRFGTTGYDAFTVLKESPNGGYLLGGWGGGGVNGDKTQPSWGDYDYWMVKINNEGEKEWDKQFGGTREDLLFDISATKDGGYILGGRSKSGMGGDRTHINWNTWFFPTSDYWIVKTDSLGNYEWDGVYGGNKEDDMRSVIQTSDGGYMLVGFSSSDSSGDRTQPNWNTNPNGMIPDYWIVKIDSVGNKMWDKRFGTLGSDILLSLIQTFDGGYLLGGEGGGGIEGDKEIGEGEFWVIKIDSDGNKEWEAGYSAGADFMAMSNTQDGGCIISANASSNIIIIDSNAFDKSESNMGITQTWVLKIDSTGNKQWDKTIFSLGGDYGGYAVQTPDGCYAVANSTRAGIGGYQTHPNRDGGRDSTHDYWVVKFCMEPFNALNEINKEQNQVLVYPNPFSSDISIALKKEGISEAVFTVSNAMGQVVYHRKETNLAQGYTKNLDLSFLPNGIYFIEVSSPSNMQGGEPFREVKRVVKE